MDTSPSNHKYSLFYSEHSPDKKFSLEYYKINDLKNSLKVKTYSQPYFEIYTNLDSMILKDNLICSQEKVSFLELTKDINHLEETLGFCYGVLNMIYQTRNEN